MSVVTRSAIALVAAVCAAACSAPPKQSTYAERVILLPSQDGKASALVVRRASGEQTLAAPYEGLEYAAGAEKRIASSAEDVRQRYGETLAMQPARPVAVTLYFELGTTVLTAQSRQEAQALQRRVASFPAPQVSVIGHTDTTGSDEVNDALSLKRALAVREYLIEIGIPAQAIDVVGRGARDLAVPTKQGVAEERNRRVEVRLR